MATARPELDAGASVLVALRGPLGAGKTTFAKALLSSLGARADDVQSPTFLKLIEHPIEGFGLCLHLDCYRVADPDEFEKMALESYASARLWLVEWPDLFLQYLSTQSGLRTLLGLDARFECELGADHSFRFKKV